jgi:tRNA nucleotidyltransferase (CCA-adding enzyme)
MDHLVSELGLAAEVVSWRLRLAAITRNMSHDELYLWLDKLKLKRSDSAVVRAAVVVGPLLADRLAKEDMSDWDIFRTLRTTPVEALAFALAGMERGPASGRLRRYLTDIRHRTLCVSGDDLLAMGMKKGPAVGRVLERLRELRVEELVEGRQGELEAARQIVGRAE